MLAIASIIIHYLGWQARNRCAVTCERWRLTAQFDCRNEMRPMASLDPAAFTSTNPSRGPCSFDVLGLGFKYEGRTVSQFSCRLVSQAPCRGLAHDQRGRLHCSHR